MVFVIIDDHDAAISYTGAWVAQGAPNEFNQTSHGTYTPGSGFQLWFQGSSVTVVGTVPARPTDSIQSSYSVDGAVAGNHSSPAETQLQAEYLQVFFRSGQLEFGWHVIAAKVGSVGGAEGGYWLDYLIYEVPPMTNASTTNIETSIYTATCIGADTPRATANTEMHAHADTHNRTSTDTARIVVASVVFLVAALLVLGWLFWRRRGPFRRIGRSDDFATTSGARSIIPRRAWFATRANAGSVRVTPYTVDISPPPVTRKFAAASRHAWAQTTARPAGLPPPIRTGREVGSGYAIDPPPYTATF